ncbi:MAG: hypothetical protein KAT17_00710 [Candidatus Aminicenantes bacterium]|nr:hypothetical protein [Candidatus Aminicenantes bacterium]
MNIIGKHLKNHKYIYIIITLTIILGTSFITTYPVINISDDEVYYLPHYNKPDTIIQKIKNLLPGNLQFTWFFPLNYSVYPFFSTEELENFYWGNKRRKSIHPYPYQIKKFFRKIGFFNLVLLVISGIFVYLICLKLGLRNFYAAMATALITLNFRVVYYIQGLWPEFLHYIFILSSVYFFILYSKKKRASYLIVSSFLLAYAAFTKGIVGNYYYILLVILILLNKEKIFSKKFIVTLIAFMLPYYGCITMQKINNYKKNGIFSLSTNIWVNIEASLIPEKKIQEEGYKYVYLRYFQCSEDEAEREALSKKRIFKYLKDTSIIKILNHQISNYFKLINKNSIARDIHKHRWVVSNHLLIYVSKISIFLSWFLFIFGILGAIISYRSGWGVIILIGYLGYYLSALFIVGFNIRFYIQAIPFLAIFSVLFISKIFHRNLE